MNNIEIKKIEGDESQNIYSFLSLSEWSDYDKLLAIFTSDLIGYRILEQEEDGWYRKCILKNKRYYFTLAHDDMFGNIIYKSGSKIKGKRYYKKLEFIANDIADGINTKKYIV